jgi:hypothetical protein
MAFWPTPAEIADDVVYYALCPGHGFGEDIRVLEPSAGEGSLARAAREHLPESHITCIEPDAGRAALLRDGERRVDEVVERSLESYLASVREAVSSDGWKPYDLVFMNPPFALPGQREAWADHILAIYNEPHLLAPGAIISAVTPRILLTGKSPRVRAVRKLLLPGQVDLCESGSFGAAVSTILVRIEKS